MKKFLNFLQFMRERFDPVSHLVMIALFVGGHLAYIKIIFPELFHFSPLQFILSFFMTTFFFLKLRCYDEIKDYETDLKINPGRPLPRGLISHNDLYFSIVLLIIMELIVFLIGSTALPLIFIFSILYSLLMFKEFYIPLLIRPHLTTYAISHTVVTVFLSLSLFTFFIGNKISMGTLLARSLPFSLSAWALFNLFEFGRKTYARSEERPGVSTYSNIWGRKGAVLLSFSQAILSSLFLMLAVHGQVSPWMIFLFCLYPFLLLVLGAVYVKKDETKSAKLFRNMSSFYIVIIFLTLNSLLFLPLE